MSIVICYYLSDFDSGFVVSLDIHHQHRAWPPCSLIIIIFLYNKYGLSSLLSEDPHPCHLPAILNLHLSYCCRSCPALNLEIDLKNHKLRELNLFIGMSWRAWRQFI